MRAGSGILAAVLACALLGLAGCASVQASPATSVVSVNASSLPPAQASSEQPSAYQASSEQPSADQASSGASAQASFSASAAAASSSDASEGDLAGQLRKKLDIDEEYHADFVHGDKPAQYQKYIVLHDTEGDGEPEDIVGYWERSETGVAAHFVVGKDGHIVQCVPLDKIAHHAGYGDTGNNEKYGVEDESRDDKEGTEPIGSWAADYGMNSHSIGIEMIHVGDEDDYPAKQLKALDKLIAYIDAYYGFESEIVDHKAWRSGNSDTTEEFAEYLENYQDHRSYK